VKLIRIGDGIIKTDESAWSEKRLGPAKSPLSETSRCRERAHGQESCGSPDELRLRCEPPLMYARSAAPERDIDGTAEDLEMLIGD
jgi:hypothetical protein